MEAHGNPNLVHSIPSVLAKAAEHHNQPHLLCQLKIALTHSVRCTKNGREKLFTVSKWRTNLVAVDEIFQDFVERMAHV